MNKMTHKHIPSKIPIILMALAALTGCRNIYRTVEDSEQTATKYGKIAVAVDMNNLPQNACFSQDNSTQNARSAMPSTFDGAEYVFAGAVHNPSTTVTKDMLKIADSATPDATKEKLTVMIPFEISTSDRENYTLSVYVFKSGTTSISESEFASPIFYGTTTITIPANAISPSSIGNVILSPKTIPDSINGNISLKISVPKNYTLSAECKTSGHSSSSCEFAFTKDTELSDASTTSDFYTFSESDTSTGIASGEHDVTFKVEKSSASVYVWTETITVYPYLTTDSWTLGNVDANGTRVISNSQFYSTFYVSGTSPKVFDASGDDSTGDGSLTKPYATVQKAIDRIKNGDGSEYTIYVDGTITAAVAGYMADFSEITGGKTVKIFGINSSSKAVLDGHNISRVIKTAASLELTLKNIKITKGFGAGGSAVYVSGENATVIIEDCEFTNNVASSSTYAGGAMCINADGGKVEIYSSKFQENSTATTSTSGYGGAIYAYKGELIIYDGSFLDNTANGTDKAYGGCIFSTADCPVTIKGGTFKNNKAESTKTSIGGLIYSTGATVTIEDGTFESNSAGTGGLIYAMDNSGGTASNITISGGTFTKNSATTTSGGMAYLAKGSLTISGGTFTQNSAATGGGVICSAATCEVEISGTTTFGQTNADNANTAQHGGAIFNGGKLTISNGKILYNKASSYGGGIYNDGTGEVIINGGEISGNTATQHGGGIYNKGTFKMSGAAYIPAGADGKNDVYLPSGKFITITGALTGTTPVATITPFDYTEGTQVLDLSAIAEADRAATCGKFALSDATSFEIQPDSTDSKKGVLKKLVVSASGIEIEVPNYSEYTATLSTLTPAFGGSVTLTLKKNGAEVTPSSCTMELYTSDDLVTPIATSSAASITIPAFLSETGNKNFKVRIIAHDDGVLILDDYYAITVQ